MPTIKIHNATTDEIIEREMNAEELKQWEKDQEEAKLRQKAKADIASNKALILERLGITEEEAKLLLL